MCLYPILIDNPKYKANFKNGGDVPIMKDKRVAKVPIGCGQCIECRKQKARGWQVRLSEEIKHTTNGKFVTLTFSNESLQKLQEELQTNECNAVATLAVRRFLERWRKKYKKSVKHWLITELGHQNTQRIHLHGLIFTDVTNAEMEKIWSYGKTDQGKYVNQRSVNYIVKYLTKTDKDHKNYKPIVLCSAGIGKQYLERLQSKNNRYRGTDTDETYRLPNGRKIALPIYYRNKIYSEEEREQLWLQKLDKQERWVDGEKYDIGQGLEAYNSAVNTARWKNKLLGYGSDEKEYKQHDYNTTVRELTKLTKQERLRRDIEKNKKKRQLTKNIVYLQAQTNKNKPL